MEKINVIVMFSQSKTYQTDWKVRLTFKKGYVEILTHDFITKETKFGLTPDKNEMLEYAINKVKSIAEAFGFEPVITYA